MSALASLLFLIGVMGLQFCLGIFWLGCCCTDCTICSDNFDRADSADPDHDSPCGWTGTGTWDITSNQLRCTAAGHLICLAPHPDAATTMVVEADIKHSTSGSACDLVVCYVDDDNLFYVRYTFGTNTIAIRKAVGGVHSTIKSRTATLSTATFYAAKACVKEDGKIVASLDGIPMIHSPVQSVSGTYGGVGGSGSGTGTFDNFVISRSLSSADADADCEACAGETCGNCDNFDLTFGAVTDVLCTNCDTAFNNTTFTLPRSPNGFAAIFGSPSNFYCGTQLTEGPACFWDLLLPGTGCSYTGGFKFYLSVGFGSDGHIWAAVQTDLNTSFGRIVIGKYQGPLLTPEEFDCAADYTFTYSDDNGDCPANGTYCNFPATITGTGA
jgi:hypothetical protein